MVMVMNSFYRDDRKIDPSRGAQLGDGTPNDRDRIEIGPTQLAFKEWQDAGLELPNLAAMRAYRHKRLVDHIVARDLAGVLVFDPLNIRYATDTTNMQLWNTHNPFRACLICADGHMVLWDYKNSPFLAQFNAKPIAHWSRCLFCFGTQVTKQAGRSLAINYCEIKHTVHIEISNYSPPPTSI